MSDQQPRDSAQPPRVQPPAQGQAGMQGEGDYEAARRYRSEIADYLSRADIDAAARNAQPQSPAQARELLQAEDSGKARSKGEDPRDAAAMYPGKTDPDVDEDG